MDSNVSLRYPIERKGKRKKFNSLGDDISLAVYRWRGGALKRSLMRSKKIASVESNLSPLSRRRIIARNNVSTIIAPAFCRNNRDSGARLKIKSSAACPRRFLSSSPFPPRSSSSSSSSFAPIRFASIENCRGRENWRNVSFVKTFIYRDKFASRIIVIFKRSASETISKVDYYTRYCRKWD